MLFNILFKLYMIIVDISVIHLYFKTVFSKPKKLRPFFYWSWLVMMTWLPTLPSIYLFGRYDSLKIAVMAATNMVMIFLMSLLYETNLRHRLFVSFVYLVFAAMSEDIPGAMLRSVLHLNLEQTELIVQAQSGFFILFLVCLVRAFYRKKERPASLRYSIAIIITPLLSVIIMLGDNAASLQELETPGLMMFIVKVVCLFIINIINFVLLDNFFTIQKLEEEKSILNQQIAYQTSKYSQISTAYRSTRSILHDTKKHFMYLQQCIQGNDAEHGVPYMERALQELEGTYSRVNSGNLVVDAFVSNNMELAEREGISYTTDININPNLVPVEDYDLSVILGNLLDNALEECRNIKPPATRSIYVQLLTTDTAFALHIVNSSEPADRNRRKNDLEYRLYHGYGLENVRAMVRQYKGSYDLLQKEHYYDVAIMIPIIKDRLPKRVGDAY